MKYRKYLKYKDSGIEWIGEIPEGWEVKKIGALFEERSEHVNDIQFPPLSVSKDGISPQLEHVAKTDNGENRKMVCLGDFVINSRSDRKGASGVSGYNGSVSLIYIVLKNKSKVNMSFFHHLLRSYPFQEEFFRYGKGIVSDLWTTPYDQMKSIVIPLPSVPEQTKIAFFVNSNLSRINKLITTQQEIVLMLKEKRQAIITHAVTKGLDPNVPMKDSGIEWIGEIPEHWKIDLIKHTSYVKGRVGWKGLTSDEYLADGYAYLVTGQDFFSKHIDWESCFQVDKVRYDNDPHIQLVEGDLLLTKDGTIGKLAVVKNLQRPACLNSGIFLVRPTNSYLSDYLYWVLSSKVFSGYYEFTSIGSTIQHLYQNTFENFHFPIPPISEQTKIIQYLENRITEIDLLMKKQQRMVALLNEHKSSLVSEAVTGKIDVRSLIQEAKEPAGQTP